MFTGSYKKKAGKLEDYAQNQLYQGSNHVKHNTKRKKVFRKIKREVLIQNNSCHNKPSVIVSMELSLNKPPKNPPPPPPPHRRTEIHPFVL